MFCPLSSALTTCGHDLILWHDKFLAHTVSCFVPVGASLFSWIHWDDNCDPGSVQQIHVLTKTD